ncbi:hypothetical protein A1I_07780 [Rickettsia bellii OSU 85-389]|uniref:DUF637 domain-containing protein n=1 Tax=Rickettsia bellii TaxID=33990 RepID=UPI0000DB10D2|nr:DUF637 domain-containing protein [Rickettsia bellii]ABV79854.1 hypothetical protein A1I_07780 [Rickettsia bellii OSU 85-389]
MLLRTTVNTAIKGGSLRDNFKSEALRGALAAGQGYIGDIGQRYGLSEGGAAKVMMHSALGGTYALASKGNAAIGMLAGGMGEALSGLTSPESSAHAFSGTGESSTGLSNWNDTIVAATAMLAGGSASDISTATTISSSVVEYNNILHQEHRDFLEIVKQDCSDKEKLALDNAMLVRRGAEKGITTNNKELLERVEQGRSNVAANERLEVYAKALGKEHLLEYSKWDAIEDFFARNDKTITQIVGSTKIVSGSAGILASGVLGSTGFGAVPGAFIATTSTMYALEGYNQAFGEYDHNIESNRVLSSLKGNTSGYMSEKGGEVAFDLAVSTAIGATVKVAKTGLGLAKNKIKSYSLNPLGKSKKASVTEKLYSRDADLTTSPKLTNIIGTPANDNKRLRLVETSNTTNLNKNIKKEVVSKTKKTVTSNIKTVEKQVQKIHKNSHKHVGDTHVYNIFDKEGKTYKIGESAQGLTKYGESKRARQQARKLERETGEFYDTEIRKTFDSKKDAYKKI